MNVPAIKRWVSLGLGVAILGAAVTYIATHWEDFSSLRRLNAPRLLAILAALVLSYLVGGYQLNLLLRRYGVALRWYRWFGLYMTMTVGNYVTPVRGGTGVGAVYLKTRHGLNFKSFGMVLIGSSVLSALVNAVLALAGMGVMHHAGRQVSWILPAVSCAVLSACVVSFLLPRLGESRKPVWNFVVRAVNGWHQLFENRSLLWRMLTVTFVQSLTQMLLYVLIYRALGVQVHPAAVLTIASLGIVGSLLSVTPGSLGPYDATVMGVTMAFGISAADAAAAVVVYRCASLPAALVLAGAFSFALRPARR